MTTITTDTEIVTHNGVFHADEVTAIALLVVFGGIFITPERVAHQTPIEELKDFDLVLDIGKKHDGIKFFDHHQYKGGKSTAGLIWDNIGLAENYPVISELVDMVDKHDTGEKKAGRFEFPSIIASMNNENIYSPAQDNAFDEAVEFAADFINSLKKEQDELAKAAEVAKASKNLSDEGLEDVIELSEFHIQWNTQFNGEVTPEIEAVVWFDENQNCWKAQVTPKKVGSFEFNGRKFSADDSMDFVHAAGFFAVAKKRETIISFLKNSRE